MSADLMPATGSSFDAISQPCPQGGEDLWSTRVLQENMGYPRWNEFEPVIERAKAAAHNQGFNPKILFRVNTEKSGGRPRVDYLVTRFAAYLIAMNGDPRKPEVAAAQAYFAIRTREAETAPQVPVLTEDEIVQQALAITTRKVAVLTERVAVLEPKAELADAYLAADGGSRLVGQAAKLLGMKEKELRAFLLSEKLIFVRHAACGNIVYDHYADFAPHFAPTEHIVNHTWGACTHYTLRITPRGIDLIRKRLKASEVVA